MSLTLDHIVLSQGAQLTDDELQQLGEIVDTQRKERSILNGDLDFDRSSGKYQVNNWDSQNRKHVYIDISFRDAMEVMDTGKLSTMPDKRYLHVSFSGKEPKQYRFIRMTRKRRGKVLRGLAQLEKTVNNSNYVDFPTAYETLNKIEEHVAKLRKTYEEGAKKLVARVNKQQVKTI